MSAELLNWLIQSPLAGRETRVMEVIKIPWEHVDACLFFHPGCEGGDLPGQYAVISTTKAGGQSVTEMEDVMVDDGEEKQMREEWRHE